VLIEIGDSRTVLRVAGVGAAILLNRGLPIDLDDDAFPVDAFAQSLIHHMPVLVHRVSTGASRAFDVYVTRDYALSFWEWLTRAAESLGCDIAAAE
jgi:methylglutamate dehydrogenase subunit D